MTLPVPGIGHHDVTVGPDSIEPCDNAELTIEAQRPG